MNLIPFTQAAKELGLSRTRLHQLRVAGKLDAVRHGHYWYVTAFVLRAFQESRAKGGTP